ncbi:S41 family peptidase [Bacteroidales bacterium OttesenSCG-928-C19]|nr:S41 family peptidase [Bacteroidales bacterium OttesenSCG-928-C19]
MENHPSRKSYQPLVIAVSICIGILLGVYLYPSIRPSVPTIIPIRLDSNNKLQEIVNLIEADYVDTISSEEVTEKAIKRLLEQLDPHSAYLPAKEMQVETESMQGNFEGIGIQFRMENDTLYVITALSGGPSQKVGIMSGDRIITINDSVVAGKEISDKDIIKMLKGKKGTKVDVEIARNGFEKLLPFTITRDVIPTYSIEYSGMLDSETGYIKLEKFSMTTHDEFRKAFSELKNAGMKSLILDLRNNGGGFLDQAIALADEFLPKDDLIVYTEGRKRRLSEKFATNKGDFEKGKLVIMIDEFSASASEIVAGAVQDNDRGIIVGRRSFGKGLVQEQFTMRDGSALRLTVARYYTPSGRSIQRPYEKGNDEYYLDYIMRLQSGELENQDSVHWNDTTEYKTKEGRIMYGGGGIMPDEFLPYEKDSLLPYYNELLRKGLIYKFCFDYVDKNRTDLNKRYTSEQFVKSYTVSAKFFDEFLAYTEEHGVEKDSEALKKYTPEIKTLMKAYIAQNLFDDKAFYAVYLSIDNDLQKTLAIIKKDTENDGIENK